jgi:superfamily I DNA and/or RNA helicase
MQKLASLILETLTILPDISARELAKKLGADKKDVNHCLYIPLKNKVVQNRDYTWKLNSNAADNNIIINSGAQNNMKIADEQNLNDNFSFESLQAIRNRLLDLTGRNRLLNFKHSNTGSIRIIDEMPDQLAIKILEGELFTFLPIEEPKREELITHGYIVLDDKKAEVNVKPVPKAVEWAKIKGFNTSYELPISKKSTDDKHNDTNIQSLLYPRELEAQLRNIRSKANTAIEETGANILYLAFGFMEWFEDENSDTLRQAPLYLIPVKIDRATLNKATGTYTYNIEYTGEDIISNLSLREKLKHDFHLELPELVEDIHPEEYFAAIQKVVLQNKPKWNLKRFATLAMFDFGKLLMYLDLDPARWPQNSNNIQHHDILKKFFANQGAEESRGSSTSFGSEYQIDTLEDVHELYPLIDDADSSQHSALVDAIKGKNLVIEGPPGSGKSQTITNLIAAAICQGKKVLFVAEKMAALDVVKSRLERAGLGDFCLELHSHKTQKKQVYENIAERMNRQEYHAYPSSMKIDIQMYEEKKEALTNYADLINSVWKNTGRTIHQIFTTATRFREEFPDLTHEDIKPDHISGQKFDEISSRRTTDELKKYADVYQQVIKQLGINASLSEHPWFGVYNKGIQLFECEEICKLLEKWDQSIKQLLSCLKPINNQFFNITKQDEVATLLNDASKLPTLVGNEYFPALTKLSPEKQTQLTEHLKKYELAIKELMSLKTKFEAIVIVAPENFDKVVQAANWLNKITKNSHLNLSNYYQQLQLLIGLQQLSDSIVEDLKTVITQDNTLAEVLSTTYFGLVELEGYLKFVDELDPLLISRRHEIFDNELLDKYLPQLDELLLRLKPLYLKLDGFFNLTNLPPTSELREIQTICANAGFFAWFNGEWRAAKTKLLAISKSVKPNLKRLVPLLTDLISYKELYEKLKNEDAFKDFLKHEYKGIETPISELIILRTWYKNIRSSYGVGFGKKVVFASSLFTIEAEKLKGLKHLAASKTLNELHKYLSLFTQLESVFTTQYFQNKQADICDVNGLSSFISELENNMQSIQSAIKSDINLLTLNTDITQCQQFFDIEHLFENETIVSELFEQKISLDLRNNSDDGFSRVQSTLVLSLKINELEFEQLRHHLVNHISSELLNSFSVNLRIVQNSFDVCQIEFDHFSRRVELDKTAWLQNTGGVLTACLERNLHALSQPKWLSSWVDFIRIRTSLSDNGLENLLRYTETGAINLDDLEKIYLCSVFDILSREIITEKQELAYFSGADQNAIRGQFRKYDDRLKTLQQKKIANRVAHRGYGTLIDGVSSGKVANYSEMGLINNEINKRTRHLPIRQLIKRAGKSLVALKPCFMMGPHSVAQYLEPGHIEFDLVVMDEASQIKPEDALGTIARGKQLVVVGDPKQLPPTSFFDKAVENEEEDATAIEQSESILDVSLPMFNARRLRWHYRSRHESLIAFSNQQFYNSDLVVFPSPSSKSDEFGIKFTHVKSGRFVNQHNIEEAKVIAHAVRHHLLNNKNESLGVVAMSAKQREQIERCVEELSKDDTQFRDALADNSSQDESLFLKNLENVQGDERDVIFISCTYGPQEAGAPTMPQRFGPINSAAGGRRLNVLFTRSKKRMHVFSSMTEGHIQTSATSSAGVHALKTFLAYAQTGKLQQLVHTDRAPDSDFEVSVMNALKLEGFTCEPQVGVTGYFIDLAVKDPGQPGRYLMGIECDGATYHSAKSARDRDRLRQSVLEGLGWNIQRIWSTDWFKNPQAQLKPIVDMLHELKTEIRHEPAPISAIELMDEVIAHEIDLHHSTETISESGQKLPEKLQNFAQFILNQAGNDVQLASSILRPAMIDALCEFKPISKNEFLEVIPAYLRAAISTKHGKYLEQILNIIAEDEIESVE